MLGMDPVIFIQLLRYIISMTLKYLNHLEKDSLQSLGS